MHVVCKTGTCMTYFKNAPIKSKALTLPRNLYAKLQLQ